MNRYRIYNSPIESCMPAAQIFFVPSSKVERSLDELMCFDGDSKRNPLPSTWGDRTWAKYYSARPDWTDVADQFRELVKRFSMPANPKTSVKILEVGAGSTNETTSFLASLGEVTGLDITSDVKNNKYCEDSIVYDGIHIPCDNNRFDIVVAYFVLEHVEYPTELCREIHRVLRSGSCFIFLTTNLWHYYSLAAKLSPYWFHRYVYKEWYKMLIYEPHPVFHRMNTRRACRKILESSGFRIKEFKLVEMGPFYARFSRLLFYPLMVWERILSSISLLQNLRSNILCAASVQK